MDSFIQDETNSSNKGVITEEKNDKIEKKPKKDKKTKNRVDETEVLMNYIGEKLTDAEEKESSNFTAMNSNLEKLNGNFELLTKHLIESNSVITHALLRILKQN